METEDPLSELADIHLPGEVSAWPPAFGWWLVAVLLAAALALGAHHLFKLLTRRRREAAALRELEDAVRRYHALSDDDANRAGLEFLAEVNAILRRVALYHYPDAGVAALFGDDWLAFLDARDGGDTFRTGPGRALGEGQYRRVFDADAEALRQCAYVWIQRRYRVKERAAAAPSTLGELRA